MPRINNVSLGPQYQNTTGAPRLSAGQRANLASGRSSSPPAAGGGPIAPAPNQNTAPGAPSGTAGTAGAGNPSPNPIDPVDVQVGQPTLNSFQQFQDQVYGEATRRLDPQFEQQRATLEQQMINRGFQPGTQAYAAAVSGFEQDKADAYAGARAQALQQGLAAQEQAFGQSYRESQLANALLQAREGNAVQMQIANNSGNQAANAAEIGRQNFLDQLAFNREQAGTSADQWNRQFGFGQQQWQDQFGLQSGQADYNNMLALLDRDFAQQSYNAGLGNQDYQRALQLFGMVPSGGPVQIDAVTPYQMQQQGQQANYQNQMAAYNGGMGALGGLASTGLYMLCDATAKTQVGMPNPADCTAALRQMPLVSFTYNDDPTSRVFIGTYAQDFGRAVHGKPGTEIGVLDAFGLVLGALKDQDARLQAIEAAIARISPGIMTKQTTTTPKTTTEH